MKAALLFSATGRRCLLLICSSALPPCMLRRFLPCDQTIAATVFAAVTRLAFPTPPQAGVAALNPPPAGADEAQTNRSVGTMVMPLVFRLAAVVKWLAARTVGGTV